jgi:hypothetical protein
MGARRESAGGLRKICQSFHESLVSVFVVQFSLVKEDFCIGTTKGRLRLSFRPQTNRLRFSIAA